MNEDVKESLNSGLNIEMGKFIKYVFEGRKGKNVNSKRPVKGVFKEEGSDKIHKGDNCAIWDIGGDALLSYQGACAYFNHTLRDGEKKRIAVSAEWDKGSILDE